jgi:hypothetical protein
VEDKERGGGDKKERPLDLAGNILYKNKAEEKCKLEKRYSNEGSFDGERTPAKSTTLLLLS